MKSDIIFPQTAWLDSSLGFAGIEELSDMMTKRNIKHKVIREYQAIVFEIGSLNEETLKLVTDKLPDDYEIPALLEGHRSIISKDEVIRCDATDEKFQELMRDAHLQVSTERHIEEIPELSFSEVNRLCNDFADSEGIFAFKGFDIEKIHRCIDIDKKFEHRLTGILVDIKGILFAVTYDLYQFGRNTGDSVNSRFKRYIYINNAIVRIRALWEKLIGLAVLLQRPDDFDRILSAKRVRSTFITKFKDSQHPVVRAIWDYLHSLDTFEERFRSPELHKIGRTIWWAARKKPGEETNRLLAYYNDLNRLLRGIIEYFEGAEK